jgi:hypothetical protein
VKHGNETQATQRLDYIQIRERQNHLSGTGLSLFLPGGCPNDRNHRNVIETINNRKEKKRWVYGGGKVLTGLVTRREAEVALLL